MASLPSSFRRKNGLSTVRFLGVLKQPDSPSGRSPTSHSGDRRSEKGDGGDLLELDESDVLWSAASYGEISDSLSPVGYAGPKSPPSNASTGRWAPLSPSGSYPNHRRQRDARARRAGRPFTPERFGLSAALMEEPGLLVQQRKSSLDPSAAARTVPPVAVPRAGLVSDGYSTATANVIGKSAPVNVPVWPRKLGRRAESTLSAVDDWMEEREWDEEDDDGEMIPPHLIVARSHGMSFSVFEGVGRTLKGRDLRRVRNAVFQKTGFLD